jgi:hypothetical protein
VYIQTTCNASFSKPFLTSIRLYVVVTVRKSVLTFLFWTSKHPCQSVCQFFLKFLAYARFFRIVVQGQVQQKNNSKNKNQNFEKKNFNFFYMVKKKILKNIS